jgi:putative transposase
MAWLSAACAAGARREAACRAVGLSVRTWQRWQREGQAKVDGRTIAVHRPANQLSEDERQRLLAVANAPEFRSLPPSQIVPALADREEYLASESTFYRVLRAADQAERRGRARPLTRTAPKAHRATAPNQLWSWDITYLATTVRGAFFYLYLILDVYSRKIVGLEVFEAESAEHATTVVRRAYLREGIAGQPLVLHSDHGAPMKGATLLATLQKLGVVPSFSRPSVSNDNPYSEALFRTLKYVPSYPSKPFETVEQARDWALGFQQWYHEEHKHSALKFVTPGERHRGEDKAILARRRAVYAQARAPHPERWSGAPRDGDPDHEVWLNPPKEGRRKAAASQT